MILPRKDGPRTVGYCHHNDTKAKAVMRDVGQEIGVFVDANHVMEALVYSDFSEEERIAYWLISLAHFADVSSSLPPLQPARRGAHSRIAGRPAAQ
jgi:hypothetical protein